MLCPLVPRIYQRLNDVAGIYMNESYSVVEVLSVNPGGDVAGNARLGPLEDDD